jgi:hypothetical protein
LPGSSSAQLPFHSCPRNNNDSQWDLVARARHLHAIGNHKIPDSRMVNSFNPLNTVIYVIDFDSYAECLMNGSLIQMPQLFGG